MAAMSWCQWSRWPREPRRYRRMARRPARYGVSTARSITSSASREDVQPGKLTSFPQAVKLKPGEIVWFRDHVQVACAPRPGERR